MLQSMGDSNPLGKKAIYYALCCMNIFLMNHLVCLRGAVQRRIGRPGNVSGITAPPACGPSGG